DRAVARDERAEEARRVLDHREREAQLRVDHAEEGADPLAPDQVDEALVEVDVQRPDELPVLRLRRALGLSDEVEELLEALARRVRAVLDRHQLERLACAVKVLDVVLVELAHGDAAMQVVDDQALAAEEAECLPERVAR